MSQHENYYQRPAGTAELCVKRLSVMDVDALHIMPACVHYVHVVMVSGVGGDGSDMAVRLKPFMAFYT